MSLFIYALLAISCSFLVYKNYTMWICVRNEMITRLHGDNVVIFPRFSPKFTHFSVHNHDFSPKVLDAVWNKYHYELFMNASTCTIKYFSDSEYYNKVAATIPYLNIQWLSMNLITVLIITIISWFIPLGIEITTLTTTVSMTVGVLSIVYMLLHRYYSKKWFGSDDMFYDEPIKADYMMVLSEERS